MGRRVSLNTFNIMVYLNYAQRQCVDINVLEFGRMRECWAFKKRAETLPEHVFHMIAGNSLYFLACKRFSLEGQIQSHQQI